MSIRGYATLATAVMGSIFGFEMIWNFTTMEAIGAMFTALLIGIFAACAFIFITEPRKKKEKRPSSMWIQDGELSVLIQKTRRVS